MGLGRITDKLVEALPPTLNEIGRRLLSNLKIRREFALDRRDYLKTCGSMPDEALPPAQVEREITIAYHQVEKGFSLPSPKRPFGQQARKTMADLAEHRSFPGISAAAREAVSDATEALDLWQHEGHISSAAAPLGAPPTPRPELDDFFASRRSCRSFDMSRRVPEDTLRKAVLAAQQSPSVCNRQASRVRLLTEAQLIGAALQLQNGNRGFTDGVPALAVITVDRSYFRGPGERNQRWIDGALFAMTLVWALHAQGLATCMLNWSMGATATQSLRNRLGLRGDHDIICMVAIGYPSKRFRVANSRRRALDDVLSWNGSI